MPDRACMRHCYDVLDAFLVLCVVEALHSAWQRASIQQAFV